MAFADRTHSAPTQDRGTSHVRELMTVALLATLVGALAIRQLVPAEAVVPVLVTLLFAVSAAIAGFALLCHRNSLRLMWFDLAGGLTFIAIVVSVFIEPEQLVRLFVASDHPE